MVDSTRYVSLVVKITNSSQVVTVLLYRLVTLKKSKRVDESRVEVVVVVASPKN